MKKLTLVFEIAVVAVIVAGAVGVVRYVQTNNDTPEVNLEDYAFLGVQPDDYALSDTPYLQEIGGDWHYEGEAPYFTYQQYPGPDGSVFIFDEKGRLYSFFNEDDIYYQRLPVTEPLTAEELEAKAYSIMEQLVGSLDGYEVAFSQIKEYVGSQYYACNIALTKSYADGARDTVMVYLTDDGKVRRASCSYIDLRGEELSAAINALQPAVEGYTTMLLQDFPTSTVSETDVIYVQMDDALYGLCTITLADEAGAKWCECALLRPGEFPA